MIRVNQIKMHPKDDKQKILKEVCKILHTQKDMIKSWQIVKQSIDARKKPDIFYIYAVNVKMEHEERVVRRVKNKNVQLVEEKLYHFPESISCYRGASPVVVGSGPAGLFCAYMLAIHGFKPILIERGAPVEERLSDVEKFWDEGILDPNSNVQFGEGGAGTFSDGKLNTGVKDPWGRNKKVLEVFVEHGAPEEILYVNKPHIGTDELMNVVKNIRKEILSRGGRVLFHTTLVDYVEEDSRLKEIILEETKSDIDDRVSKEHPRRYGMPLEMLVLAIGHSARDTFTWLYKKQLPMTPKAFAVGVRVEHPQHMINESQYGAGYEESLPAAPYKLTAQLPNGRAVYSFCMCPGGYVVNASSEEGRLAVNGMSYHNRDSANANSAIVVSVTPEDFGNGVLDGVAFQRELEERAYKAGNGNIPVQLLKDFTANVPSVEGGTILPQMKGRYTFTNVREILPKEIGNSICDGMHVFGRRIKGFDQEDALLSGVESRTSSPVRIGRNEFFESAVSGIYPCGEGAGYAGGITSAAMDGIKVAESVAKAIKMAK